MNDDELLALPGPSDQVDDDSEDADIVSLEDQRLDRLVRPRGPSTTPEERKDGRQRKVGRELDRAQRRRQAFLLRVNGASYDEIGAALEISAQSANALVKRALADIDATPEMVNEVRNIELARLDVMTLAIFPRARRGDLGAVDRVLKIMERRAKLLGYEPQQNNTAGFAMSMKEEDGQVEVKVMYVDDWRTQ